MAEIEKIEREVYYTLTLTQEELDYLYMAVGLVDIPADESGEFNGPDQGLYRELGEYANLACPWATDDEGITLRRSGVR